MDRRPRRTTSVCSRKRILSDSTHREPIELLAEEFLDRRRHGERVSVEDYAARNPDHADEIRELFPTIAALEGAKPDAQARSKPAAFEAPQRLGDLRLLREIGRGGMGVVYEAQQESLGRRVAVKVLPARILFDTKQLERFRREARTAGALQHPGIVPIYSVGEQDGLHYLVMQLVDGVGLDVISRQVGAQTQVASNLAQQSLAAGGDDTTAASLEEDLALALLTNDFSRSAVGAASSRPPSDQAPTVALSGDAASSLRAKSIAWALTGGDNVDLRAIGPQYYRGVAKIGAQAAEALAHAHHRGILHRDIKPANLLLDRTGKLWITDFGLAKAVDQQGLSQTGELLGTLRYMPPEQLRGEATAASDLYALGLTLYELVTFRSPFDAATPSEVLQKINEHRPQRPRQHNPHVPLDLERIILRAMAAEPGDRYPAGEPLAEDLRRFLQDEPVAARPPAVLRRAKRWIRQRQTAAIALAAFMLGGGLILGLMAATAPTPPTLAPSAEQPPSGAEDPSLQARKPAPESRDPRQGPPDDRRGRPGRGGPPPDADRFDGPRADRPWRRPPRGDRFLRDRPAGPPPDGQTRPGQFGPPPEGRRARGTAGPAGEQRRSRRRQAPRDREQVQRGADPRGEEATE